MESSTVVFWSEAMVTNGDFEDQLLLGAKRPNNSILLQHVLKSKISCLLHFQTAQLCGDDGRLSQHLNQDMIGRSPDRVCKASVISVWMSSSEISEALFVWQKRTI
jgi:hypothetical protein